MLVITTFFRPTGRAIGHRKLAASLAAVLLLGLTGSGTAISAPSTAKATYEDDPTIQYRDAMAHAADPNTFVPGDAVTIPYTPRVGDQTIIDGARPVALPAGSATGAAMAATPNDSVWAVGETDPPSGGSDKQAVAAPLMPGSGTAQAAPAVANSLRREVYGFLPYWRVGSYINYDVVSTVAYFGIDLNTDGTLDKQQNGSDTTGWAGWTSSGMTTVLNDAHAHHTRVALTIQSFAWSTSGIAAQQTLLSSPAYRLTAAQQIAGAVRDRGADGVNLDFEPIASGQSANYVTFVRLLRTELDKIHVGYELTFCATGHTGNYDATNLLATGAADNVFIMGYDFRNGASPYASSHDPLTSPRVYDLTDAINSYKALAPASKILLGVPYYGIAYSTVDTSQYSTNQSGTTYGDAVWVPYYTAADLALTNLKQYDTIEESAWVSYYGTFGGAATWRELYYDDARALGARYDRINYLGLGGVGIWVLGYDAGHPELNQVLADKFLTDRNPPKAGIVNIAPTQASESFTVSWTGRDDWNGVKNYDIQVAADGGAWTDWIAGTTATSSSFEGTSGHSYSFRARATDGVGNVGAWDITTAYSAYPTFGINGYLETVTSPVAERGRPTTASGALFTVGTGVVFQIIGGPVEADGFTWYQVNGPITESNPVTPTFPGCWIAVGDGSNVFATPVTPPNTTAVDAGVNSLAIGTTGVPASTTEIDSRRTFSPDGDGIKDTLSVRWHNQKPFTDLKMTVYRTDGIVAGVRDLGAMGAGDQSLAWDGKIDGILLPDAQYLIQISGTDGVTTDYAPSQAPFDSAVWAHFGAIIDLTPSGTYKPISPVRILDSRIALGLSGPFTAGKSRSLVVTGHNNVPPGAMAVTGNLTITGATNAGFLRVGPTTTGTYSTINFGAGDTRANGVTMSLAADGSLSVLYVNGLTKGSVHVIFDLTGYFARDPSGSTFVPISPARLVDTRNATGIKTILTANGISAFQVGGVGVIPPNATAVIGNATIVGQSAAGYITIAPSIGPGVPGSSTVNFPVGDVRANNIVVPLNAGYLQVEYRAATGARTHFIFDVTGYFLPGLNGATYVPLAPGRVVDSRTPQGLTGALKASTPTPFPVRGQASVPISAIAVVGNLTVTAQSAAGWLSITPTTNVTTSTINFPLRDTRANGFTCPLGTGGMLTITYGATLGSTTQVVVDVMGYFH